MKKVRLDFLRKCNLKEKIKKALGVLELKMGFRKIGISFMVIVALITVVIITNKCIKDVELKNNYKNAIVQIDTYINEKKYDKAIKEIKLSLSIFKDEADYMKNLKNKKKTIEKLKENYEYKEYLSVAKSENVDVTDEDRIDAYTKAIDVKPQEEEPYMQAASLFVQYNEYDKAIKLLSSGVEKCEDSEDKDTVEHLTEKIEEINKLMLDSEYNNAYLELVKAYKDGDLDHVILKYNECMLKNKNDARLYAVMAKAYFEKNKYSEAINVLNTGIDRLKSIGANNKKSNQYNNYSYLVKLKKKYEKIQITSNKYASFYKKLLVACKKLKEKDSDEEIRKVINSYEYATIAACNDVTYYTNKGAYAEAINTGVGIAVYRSQYIYYGDWKDGKRSGDGYLFVISKTEEHEVVYMYKGKWNDGYPSGAGSIIYEMYKDNKVIYKTITKGTFIKGYEDGDMTITKSGDSLEFGELKMKYKAKMGEPVIKTEKGNKLTSADGSYIIGYYYDKDNKKREIASVPVEDGKAKQVNWRVSGLSYK